MKIPINPKKIKKTLLKAPGFLARKSFFVFLFLVLIDLLIGLFVFYQSNFPSWEKSLRQPNTAFQPKRDLLESVLNSLDLNEQKFELIDNKTYPNFFGQVEELTE
jgi:hypothetical protein